MVNAPVVRLLPIDCAVVVPEKVTAPVALNVTACISADAIMLAPLILPVVENAPVPTIPTVTTLPVELNVAPTTEVPALIIPAAFKLAPSTLPLTDIVPVTYCPLVDQTAMFATFPTVTVAFPPAEGI